MNLKNLAYFFITSISIVVILIFGKSLLIPFVFALLLWFVMRKIRLVLDKVRFVKNKFPAWAKNLIASALLLTILAFASQVISSNIKALAQSYKKYEVNLDALMNDMNDILNLDIMEMIEEHSGDFDLGAALGLIFNSLTDILSNAFMIILYALFIFLEQTYFRIKLKNLFTDADRFDKVSGILGKIELSITKYLGLKTFVSLLTGLLSYVVLVIIGIDSPVFWAFLIFVLNFIPTIGSLIGTLFPAAFCLLQFGEFTPGLMVLLFVGAIQIIVGNIIEPKLMGTSMNISSLVTIIALSFWGAIWGVTGMILSVPITVIMVIVFSQFPATKPIAIALSEKGETD
ncbi:AI-2E family transporter [Fulvivirga sp. M361]|uniref:AI-2E family transporter n=1 Tax=Fulvivirga sp. M361 TaxID=2594266 RepID=UPI0016247E3B|nr:AI-2E family transporter [Fulvivirga sp. M361]